jgi:IclR family transcriptional regulator, KDG regulon repressor
MVFHLLKWLMSGGESLNLSVKKALKLLDLFIQDMELSLADIARKADLSKPTAYRLLLSLLDAGFLTKVTYSEQDIRYRLGLKLLELGNIVSMRLELRRVALPHMQDLSRDIDEIVHLVIRDGDETVYIEKVESTQAIRLFTRVGKRSPLYAGSGPKLLLAYLTEEEQMRILAETPLLPVTSQTVTNPDKLRTEIKAIRRNGYATSEGEQDIDTVGISWPIRDFHGSVIAALGVTGLKFRFSGERMSIMQQKTMEAAGRISVDLGYLPQEEQVKH